jgi:hypothetical protein
VQFSCTACKQQLSAPDTAAGQQVSCPHCKQPLSVPFGPESLLRTLWIVALALDGLVLLWALAASAAADGRGTADSLRALAAPLWAGLVIVGGYVALRALDRLLRH